MILTDFLYIFKQKFMAQLSKNAKIILKIKNRNLYLFNFYFI